MRPLACVPRLTYNRLAALAAVAIMALSVIVVWRERAGELWRAEQSVLNTASIVGMEIQVQLDQIDALLVTIGRRYQDAADHGREAVDHLDEQLRAELAHFPLISRIGVTDADGAVVFNTGFQRGASYRIDLADRGYFQRLKSGDANLEYVGPVRARLTGEWSMALVRRLDDGQGRFAGIIFVVLPVDAFGRQFAEVALGAASSINLRTLDLAQVIRYPMLSGSDQGTGNRNVSTTIRRLMQAAPGRDHYTYRTVAPIDGVERVYAYKKLERSPFWLTIGVASEDFVDSWRLTAVVLAIASLSTIAVLFSGVRRLNRQYGDLQREFDDKVLAERALRSSEARIKATLNAVPDLVCRFDGNGRLIDYKPDHADVGAVDAPAQTAPRVVQHETIGEQVRAVLATGRAAIFEIEEAGGDGASAIHEVRIAASGADEVVAVLRDVTDRRAAAAQLDRYRLGLEEMVRQRTAQLNAANDTLAATQRAMDAVGIGILWVDAESGRLTYANRYMAEFLGYSEDELLHMSLPDIDTKFTVQDLIASSRLLADAGYQRFESTQRSRDERLHPVEVTAFYHPGGGGISSHLIAFVIDIARRKEAETALLEAKQRAEKANRAKSAFLANMSHEIRTPLNAITGMVYALRRAGASPEQSRRLDTIDSASHHLIETINAILDLSKIEAGKLTLEDAEINPELLLENVTSILKQRATQKGLYWHTEIDELPRGLRGDPTRTQQALLNYASNAIKFTETGGITLRVKLADDADGAALIAFEVEDTGIGIDQAVIGRLFSSFEQADNSTTRKYGGTGLGLALSRHLAELMGGQAGVSSILGRGSLFWFTARLRKGGAVQESPPSAYAEDAEQVLKRDFQGTRILVVEDEPINCEVARMLLEEVGLTIDVAENGAVAVRMALEHRYPLVLMDMQMPEMDGIEATRRIRTAISQEQMPIIAMTANAFSEDRIRCLSVGMNAFVSKPVNPDELYAVLLIWLRQQTS